MWNFISRSFDRICSILMILLFCQMPLFIGQYEMRLGGHVAESARLVQDLERCAMLSHKSLKEYIDKFLEQQDSDFVESGLVWQKAVTRNDELLKAYSSLQQAHPLKRPFVFLAYLQVDVFQEALHHFTPGFSVTLETAIYGAMGLLFWLALILVLRQLTLRIRSKAPQ